MSYDIYLYADLGGPERVCVFDNWNYTSNCARMWHEAGATLADFHGRTAVDCAPELVAAIAELKANPARYIAMNPENGWGSYETLVPALERLLAEFQHAPVAFVSVSR